MSETMITTSYFVIHRAFLVLGVLAMLGCIVLVYYNHKEAEEK